ncbi:hypothetical protein PVAP13_3NG140863 [Panicum virgatum]|uniref:Uncharacterized protein n=1 Tax=Panicum virgatum TaxID=38727 RepID=A0A8T0U3Q3_PANVG|nr:hypothetical protein PVAP13_3NG140863 [Panicum virgatum]
MVLGGRSPCCRAILHLEQRRIFVWTRAGKAPWRERTLRRHKAGKGYFAPIDMSSAPPREHTEQHYIGSPVLQINTRSTPLMEHTKHKFGDKYHV